ncbi:hypothetical protein EVAR_77534_1 [Eumeta japonica]|uniref:Uncharacterized protein n=1 Tax=Eumeta variegata TaxID=151549 RepID=A0A4C1T7E1_EUMVA|nr:hypothetical protein EVAR_77534_1 [Eumeta japonica]
MRTGTSHDPPATNKEERNCERPKSVEITRNCSWVSVNGDGVSVAEGGPRESASTCTRSDRQMSFYFSEIDPLAPCFVDRVKLSVPDVVTAKVVSTSTKACPLGTSSPERDEKRRARRRRVSLTRPSNRPKNCHFFGRPRGGAPRCRRQARALPSFVRVPHCSLRPAPLESRIERDFCGLYGDNVIKFMVTIEYFPFLYFNRGVLNYARNPSANQFVYVNSVEGANDDSVTTCEWI